MFYLKFKTYLTLLKTRAISIQYFLPKHSLIVILLFPIQSSLQWFIKYQIIIHYGATSIIHYHENNATLTTTNITVNFIMFNTTNIISFFPKYSQFYHHHSPCFLLQLQF